MMPTNRPLKAKPSGRNGFADAALTGQPNVPPDPISEFFDDEPLRLPGFD